MAYGMEWRKKMNDDHLDQKLRKILGTELYRDGIFVMNLVRDITNLPFSISNFYKDLIIALSNN